MKYSKKKTLLIVTECLPYPLNSGGNIAQFEMNDKLREHFNIIMIFPLHKGQETYFEELQSIWTDVKFFPFINSNTNRLHKLIYKKPLVWYNTFLKKRLLRMSNLAYIDDFILKNSKIFSSGYLDVEGGLVERVKRVIDDNQIDYIQVEFYELLTLISYLPQNIKRIFVNHELRYVRERRELELLTTEIPFLRYLFIRNKGYEISFMNEYDRVVTVSDDDCKELSKYLPSDKLYSSPLTIKLPKVEESKEISEIKKIIFLGGEEHFPNNDGIQWFIESCWEKLCKTYPNLQFSIVGKWSDDAQVKYSKYNNILFHGFVDDLGTVLKDGIFVVPIRIGSGMRMKIIDAVNYNLPFVTTTVGVEGLLFKNNIDCLHADDSQMFINSIAKLIEDKQLRENLSKNAKYTLLTEYSHDKLIGRRLNLYQTL
ncbi:glycosyltransferase family 4 protein [Arcicella rosea]|uniref:Glycosyltransferase involved in cell wall biosynthesis n=1 Tax=Arcicella rosea TaxID=502909 RepID=A0A841ENW2_9BACT|nr:glycosyltransferase family 4 protein [Arcicella rosea]MBB6002418.1 glycosyltransferase involved in cell wall biosynthesis [Arcicella rosea]